MNQPFRLGFFTHWAAYCQRLPIAYGSPTDVADCLAADPVLPLAHDLILQFNPPLPPVAQAIRMFDQLATTVAPALGRQPRRRMSLHSEDFRLH